MNLTPVPLNFLFFPIPLPMLDIFRQHSPSTHRQWPLPPPGTHRQWPLLPPGTHRQWPLLPPGILHRPTLSVLRQLPLPPSSVLRLWLLHHKQSLPSQVENCPCPLPIPRTAVDKSLSSTEIRKDKLISVREVLDKYSHFTRKGATVRNMRMLCLKLAKEAIFGAEVMGRCTPGGTREYPALPHQEMFQLKTIMFEHYPQYWSCLHLFEEVWKQCREAIEQGCKRERRNFQ